MKNTIKNILKNQFFWDCILAIFSILLSVNYIVEGDDLLAILWALIAGCEIAEACLHKRRK